MSYSNKKRKVEAAPVIRAKPPKGLYKSQVEDIFPFEAPNMDTLSPEIKQYVSELEKQYIERYNILINNRIIFEHIFEKYQPTYPAYRPN